MATLKIKIIFKENGEGFIQFNNESYPCLGQKNRMYPKDLTINPIKDVTVKKLKHFSQEFQVVLEYAIRIWGQKGIYIHYGLDNLKDNEGDSAGCIHVEKPQIVQLYNWIDKKTRILIEYPWEAPA